MSDDVSTGPDDTTAAAAPSARGRAVRVPGQAAASDTTTAAAAPSAPVAVANAPQAGRMPNAIDIDPRAIQGPVMTRQGWVVPDETWQKANPAEFQKLLIKAAKGA
jgi:hypothetical protein